jgi:hypothetical protein
MRKAAGLPGKQKAIQRVEDSKVVLIVAKKRARRQRTANSWRVEREGWREKTAKFVEREASSVERNDRHVVVPARVVMDRDS